MINLLPPDLKADYRYARRNSRLVLWVGLFVAAIIGAGLITTGGLIVMDNSIDSYQARIANSQTAQLNQDLATAQQQVTDISNNLKLMVQVLSKEILFSKLLDRLGSITPPNVILTNLTITEAESAIDVTAQTGNYNAATQLQTNMTDPNNQVFSTADIESITCATGAAVTNPTYPCTAVIRAQFLKNNPFLFINSSGK